jgi:hypothetical protein
MNPDKQQKQSKKRRWNQFIKWFCKPETLRFLLTMGLTILKIFSWSIEKLEQLIKVIEPTISRIFSWLIEKLEQLIEVIKD